VKKTQEPIKRVAQPLKEFRAPTSLTKAEKYSSQRQLPVAMYDISAGHSQEEAGFGYLRSQYVIDKRYVDKNMHVPKFHSQKQKERDSVAHRKK